jgi:hypothetical protein
MRRKTRMHGYERYLRFENHSENEIWVNAYLFIHYLDLGELVAILEDKVRSLEPRDNFPQSNSRRIR